MKRKDLWITEYNAFIDRVREVGFDWSVIDCGPRLAGELCEALCGENPTKDLIGTYHDEQSALDLMHVLDCDNLADATALYLPEYDNPQLAQMGDIAAIVAKDSPFGYALGIVNGERVFVLHPEGVGVVNRRHISRAFKVG